MVLLRFAPSPTGSLHLGGLRTALFNHLFARKLKGKWILRIEDTDASRTVKDSVDGIRQGLEWAGLDYDFGPGRPGPHGPYLQSERLDLYHSYTKRLLDSGHAYRCFCSADKLMQTREALARKGSNSTYDKACLHLTEEEVTRRVRAGEAHVVRLNDGKLPERKTQDDLVFGPLKDAHASLATDPVLLKTDKFPTYHLANVVDDHEMGITHVLRGEEWLLSLPLHLDLYAALGLQPPRYGHLPLLLNQDGTKMSKRHGAVHVGAYMDRGWEPDAVLNWLALAGWGTSHETVQVPTPKNESSKSKTTRTAAPDSTAVMSLAELTENFEITALTHRRAVLDPAKLERLNQQHLQRQWEHPQSRLKLSESLVPLVQAAFPDSDYATAKYIGEVLPVLQGRLTIAKELPQVGSLFWKAPPPKDVAKYEARLNIPPSYHGFACSALLKQINSDSSAKQEAKVTPDDVNRWMRDSFEEFKKLTQSPTPLDKRAQRTQFNKIIRLTLTGSESGPSLVDIMSVLGRDRVSSRLQRRS